MVAPGYKQTEVGVIPEDWDHYPLEALEHAKLLSLGRGKVISKRDIARATGDNPIYSSSVTERGVFGHYEHFMFDEELITWSIDGGGDFFYRPKHRFSVTNVCGFMRVDESRLNFRFLAAQLQFLHGKKQFNYLAKAHPSVIRREYDVLIPPLREQEAIAEALSDADALIDSIEQLLAKKRRLKQGSMQELLTGRRRLPGAYPGFLDT